MSASTKHIALQVRDQEDTAYTVQLVVSEEDEVGILSILTPAGGVAEQLELTQLQKSRDGRGLTCHVGGATATLSLGHEQDTPALHVSASLFFPVFEAVYHLDRTEYRRFGEWMRGLSVGLET